VVCNCNPRVISMTSSNECGNVWLAILLLRGRQDLDIAVGDFDFGCAVIMKRLNSNLLDSSEYGTWHRFDGNRIQALNLLTYVDLLGWVLHPTPGEVE
jgi:hypothetical protein